MDSKTAWDAYVDARNRAIGGLRGTVSEIGAGRGENFSYLDADVHWIGLEPSKRFRTALAKRAHRAGHEAPLLAATAEDIPLADHSVDGVLATTVLCSVIDQSRVIHQLERILVPSGTVVLAEHVGAPKGTSTRRLQRIVRPLTKLFDHGCDPTRDVEKSLQHSRLRIERIQRFNIPMLGSIQMPYVVITARKADQ